MSNPARKRLQKALARYPSCLLGHYPTPIEWMPHLSERLGVVDILVKRDDCTGLAFGGNKVRQLDYYLGAAQREQADTVLITGAVQSNFVRTAAAAANRLGLECHIQLEERVPEVDALYRSSGNALLNEILGAQLYSYPIGEDEEGADARLMEIASHLRSQGKRPYVVPLGPGHPPLGALGYVAAAMELVDELQARALGVDHLVVTSGSGSTHAGLLFGLKALGSRIQVTGVCSRRSADAQSGRIRGHIERLSVLLDLDPAVAPEDIRLTDVSLAPGYGRLNPETLRAIQTVARLEGLLLDPVYTGKAMAGLFHLVESHKVSGNVLFWHTGGLPALFAYGDRLLSEP